MGWGGAGLTRMVAKVDCQVGRSPVCAVFKHVSHVVVLGGTVQFILFSQDPQKSTKTHTPSRQHQPCNRV